MSTATQQATTEQAASSILGVPVLAKGEVSTDKKSWTQRIWLKHDAILTVSAYATANYNHPNNPPANAGVQTTILVNDKVVAADQSFEGESSTITFYAGASDSRFLPRGDHKLEITRQEVGDLGLGQLEAAYHAVAAYDVSA